MTTWEFVIRSLEIAGRESAEEKLRLEHQNAVIRARVERNADTSTRRKLDAAIDELLATKPGMLSYQLFNAIGLFARETVRSRLNVRVNADTLIAKLPRRGRGYRYFLPETMREAA